MILNFELFCQHKVFFYINLTTLLIYKIGKFNCFKSSYIEVASLFTLSNLLINIEYFSKVKYLLNNIPRWLVF